jgi:beta-1,4-mannosyl-glycoprotein beta-1,4-N-acetylglucosaminyltransferase
MIRGKRVIDSFLFFNELEMALFRMEYLNDFVEVFVVVEAKHTFSGNEKPLYFFQNRHLFKKFRHKIVYSVYRGGNSDNPWDNESSQRNYIGNIFRKICFHDDLISYSDVDEIPNYNAITHKHEFEKPCVFVMDMYRYNINYRIGQNIWNGTKMMFWNAYEMQYKKIEDLRTTHREHCVQILNGGWHLSYFGDEHKIKTKIESFSHQELNKPEYTNYDNIKKAIKSGNDLYRRASIIEHVEFKETGLPKEIKKHIF